MANLSIIVQDGNNLEVLVTPQAPTTITLDRGVSGVGVQSMTLIDVAGETYIEILYTNGTSTQLGPLEQGVYFGQAPITVTGNQISLDDTAVTPDTYGTASKTVTFTVDDKGRLTAASEQDIAILLSQVTDAGTMASQDANAVSITGGSISGTTVSGYIPTSEKAAALGVATLDAGGTVPLTQIPASIQGGLIYQGVWNASTNTPTLTSSVGTKGHYYVVSVAGSTNLNGITDWNVGDLAVFNGSVWEQIDNTDAVTSVNGYTGTVVLGYADVGAANSGANTNITSMTGVTGGISTPDYIDIDTAATPAGAVGRLKWNDTDGTLDIGLKGGNVTLQVGQEENVRMLNNTGSAWTDLQVVRVTGAQGNRITGALALATSDATSASTLGVVTEPIANNQQGFVTTSGLVREVDTSAFAEGAVLYLSPTVAGAITTTRPTAPNHTVILGWCIRSHAVNGSIFVKVDNGYELDELHNVLITSPTSGNTLIYDAVAGVWENANISAGTGVSVTNGAGSITVANTGVTSLTGTANEIDVSASTGGVTLSLPATINANTTGSAATLTTGRTISITGDLAYTSGSFDGSGNVTGAGTLATVNSNVGSYTYASITVNAKGLVTAASNGTAPVTSVGATAPVQSSGGTTPTISMAAATTSVSGYLTSTDWNTFNSKQAALVSGTNIKTVNGNSLLGAGDVATGTVTSVASGTGLTGGPITGSGTLSLATSGVSAGSYGSSSAIPVITVDAYGRATAISTATVAGGQYFGSAAVKAIAYNANSISENVTVTAGNNGLSAGPITINTGYSVTVETGATWVIV